MPEVINVRYRSCGKSYYFAPNGIEPQVGDTVLVETSKGLKLGECVEAIHQVPEEAVVEPLRPVIRIATPEDIRTEQQNKLKEKQAFVTCEEKIRAHNLDMKLVDVEYSFEGGKILFFFTSDGRVDFRELVKDLASVFHTRIELRQIGVRDSAKMLGGLGICGRPFCCSTFLEDFQPVSIRMAKTQNLSLNPTKISGTCGRLMCCLKYEQDAYENLLKTMPKADAAVDTPKGKGTVTEVNLLRRTVKVRLAEATDNAIQSYHVDQLGYTVGGEYVEPKPDAELPQKKEPEGPDLSLYMADEPHPIGGNSRKEAEKNPEHRRDRNHSRKPRRFQNEEQGGEQTEPREPKAPREPREPKAPREQREPREPREQREPREPRENRRDGDNHRNDRHKNGKPRPQQDGENGERPQQPKKPYQSRKPGAPNAGTTPNNGAAQNENAPKQPQKAHPAEDGEKKPGNFRYHRHYHGPKKPGGGNGNNGGNAGGKPQQ